MASDETKESAVEEYRRRGSSLPDPRRDPVITRAMRPDFVREDKRGPVASQFVTKG